jgi:hypothetical protein
MKQRSLVGAVGRQYNRFYPVVLCLETLCKINEWHLNQGNYTPLYQSGVVYQAEPPGEEEWLDTPTLYSLGCGDCEDIACARVAELRKQGIPAVPTIKYKEIPINGKTLCLIHVMVLWPEGTVLPMEVRQAHPDARPDIEDPSRVLGMRGEYE